MTGILSGRWQREMPQKVGHYWTRTSDGDEASIVAVCALPDGHLFTPAYLVRSDMSTIDSYVQGIEPGTAWRGWWWSEPIPPCPKFEQ